MRSDLKKLDSFTLEISKNHLIRNFLRNGRLRVKALARKLYLMLLYLKIRDLKSSLSQYLSDLALKVSRHV